MKKIIILFLFLMILFSITFGGDEKSNSTTHSTNPQIQTEFSE